GGDAAPRQSLRIEPGILPENIKSAEDLQALNSALAPLFSQLRDAHREFECHGASDRNALVLALGAFWKFIYRFKAPYEDRLMAPILRLMDALVMLDQGLVEPVVASVRRRSGRAPASHAHASLKGLAAATVQLLLQSGIPLKEARQRVAKHLTGLGVQAER